MKTAQYIWKETAWTSEHEQEDLNPQLCLLFGTRATFEAGNIYFEKLKEQFPESQIVQCTSAGNIYDEQLLDDVIVATCLEFETTQIEAKLFQIQEENGQILGNQIAQTMNREDLSYLLLLSTTGVNAGQLLAGVNEVYQGKVSVSGGVAGDNVAFEKTLIGLNEDLGESRVVAVGFYGENLVTKHGTQGGWDPFGPKREVTKAEGNVIYELDQKPILDLYKEYLGPKAAELPSSALYFPLAVETEDSYIVRGVQDVDEEKHALILFGDVKEGDIIQLMRANFDRVIEGAANSASQSIDSKLGEPQFALLISCVGRRIVLDQLVEEELSEVRDALGKHTTITGFYSYSELSPLVEAGKCQLHNQTMTITSFYEKTN